MRPLTLIMPYYENPGMLREQLRHLTSMSEDVRAALHLIVVDDGSQYHPARLVCERSVGGYLGSASLYRIKVDVRWNWIACRNLAMHKAQTEWRLMTDIDHLVPEATLRDVMTSELNVKRAYKFRRQDLVYLDTFTTKPSPKPHPNTWLMTGDVFDRVGGYDERFSGCYGSDGEFRDRVQAVTRQKPVPVFGSPVVRVPRELVPDASTTAYTRKDPALDRGRVKLIRARRGAAAPLRLTFPWERVF